MNKKLLAMLLTVVMVMALTVPAFAAFSGDATGGPYYPSKEERLKVDVTLDGYLRTEYVKVAVDQEAYWAVQVVKDGSSVKLECPDIEQLVDKERRIEVIALSYATHSYGGEAFTGWWDESAAMFLDGLDFEQEMDASVKTFAATSLDAPEYIFTIGGYDDVSSYDTSYLYVEETIYWMSESGFAELAPELKGVPGPGSEIFGAVGAGKPTESAVPSTSTTGAVLSPQGLKVDGKEIDCEKYNIADRNYFKLRDLAQLLSGTGSQFEVGYDEATATVSITTGKPYTPNGTELLAGVDNSASAQPSNQAILINGEKNEELTVYNIGGSNFFQLRELGSILGFEVDYDQDTNTAIVNSVKK